MTDEEAGHLAGNLWLYRVRRRMSREALCAKILPSKAYRDKAYRDYEYGTAIPTHEEVAQFAERLQTTPEALMQRPDYQWLMRNYRVRKVLEYFNLLTNGKHRKAILDILHGLQGD